MKKALDGGARRVHSLDNKGDEAMTSIQKIASDKGYWAAMSIIQADFAAGLITRDEFTAHKASIQHRA